MFLPRSTSVTFHYHRHKAPRRINNVFLSLTVFHKFISSLPLKILRPFVMSDRVKASGSLVETCDVDEDCVLVFTQETWNRIKELGRLRLEREDILQVTTLAAYYGHDVCHSSRHWLNSNYHFTKDNVRLRACLQQREGALALANLTIMKLRALAASAKGFVLVAF